jgi:hypothetical protein
METLSINDLTLRLPKILYFSDVCPQDSGAGSSLVYRLLKYFPKDKLLVVTPPAARLTSGVHLGSDVYIPMADSICSRLLERFARSRFSRAAGSLRWVNSYRTNSLKKLAAEFRPEAVVSVAHGYSWNTAFRYAMSCGIPFFLIVHDDFKFTINMNSWSSGVALQAFANAYSNASGVFCVSRSMAERYVAKYQRIGTTLLPGRDRDNPVYADERAFSDRASSLPAIGYAGGLHNAGYRELVERCARIATGLGMTFCIFGPDRPTFSVEKPELLIYYGNVPSSALITKLHETVDVLFCPQSFRKEERQGMEINFPSKLTDYTAAGLPLLFWAPGYSSSVSWATEATGVACVVTLDDDDAMRSAIDALRIDSFRRRLAAAAIRLGAQYFAADDAFSKFASVLTSGTSLETCDGVSCPENATLQANSSRRRNAL